MPAASASPEPEISTPARWKRVAVILNRESGTLAGLRPDDMASRFRGIFQEAGAEVDLHCVPGAQIQKALEAARDGGADTVVVGGGDGTVASAAAMLAGSDKPLGILPLGTYNLAARDVGMPLNFNNINTAKANGYNTGILCSING